MLPSARKLLLLLPLLHAATTAASSLTVTIPPSNFLPNPNVLPAGTHATLTTLSESPKENANILSAPLTSSSTFTFPSLPAPSKSESGSQSKPKSYLLDIRSREYVFAPYRVDVAADGTVIGVWETFRGNAWSNRGAEMFVATVGGSAIEDVIVPAKVLARRGFYEERAKFSPLSLFKNPMILLAVFAMVVMFAMPKLMENMDPEMREEFEKQSRGGPLTAASRGAVSGGNPANFDLAGWMAGTTSSASAADGSSAATSGRESGGASRRRG
ncbi:hypothetical protein NFIA_037810 [Paecilomyces variotii No. 5]|uniref:ER membrane protein complex subunit 7 beta-sandwich domain-containing protein n=1 Tax=Byssochlamys spectabilis (strain No. 5 / NBRC 109023) TaxID=1356009 RepID=V5GBN4_BYSSN|nr:hypothetical protein NFIA_037810 [Paecilomyces variotii No. 5]